MTAPSGINSHDVQIGMNFHNLDDMQPSQQKFPPIGSTSYNQQYNRQETGTGGNRQNSKSKPSGRCLKPCLIGLGIGLAIGVVLVIIIAVPVGVTKKTSLGTISSTPNWIGTFKMDDACDPSSCCCLSDQVKVSPTSNNQIQITGNLNGICGSAPSTISVTESIPQSFQAILPLYGLSIRFQLGQDSSYVSIVYSTVPFCMSTALRTSYNAGNMKSVNLGLMMFVLPASIWVIMMMGRE